MKAVRGLEGLAAKAHVLWETINGFVCTELLKTMIPINSLFSLTSVAYSDRITSCLFEEDNG